jgi:iron complex outermembrane recepter protein
LNELFLTPSFGGGQGGVDPCRADQNPSEAVKDLCVQTGIPENLIDGFQQTEISFSTRLGGNPDLGEESAETWSAGIVLTPERLPNFSLSLDYYDIVVDDAIASVAPDQILSSCISTMDINSAHAKLFTE